MTRTTTTISSISTRMALAATALIAAGAFAASLCAFTPATAFADDAQAYGQSTAEEVQQDLTEEDANKGGEIVVSFDANGGTGTMDDQTTTLVAGVFKLPECGFVAPAGKQFMGWSREKDGSAKLYQTGDMFEDFNDNFTLYAIWGDQKSNTIAKTGDATDYIPVAAAAGLGVALVAGATVALRKASKK